MDGLAYGSQVTGGRLVVAFLKLWSVCLGEKFSQEVGLNAFRTFNAISPLCFFLRFDTRSNTSQKLYVWLGYRWCPVFSPHRSRTGAPLAKADRVGLKGIFRENPYMVNSLAFIITRASLGAENREIPQNFNSVYHGPCSDPVEDPLAPFRLLFRSFLSNAAPFCIRSINPQQTASQGDVALSAFIQTEDWIRRMQIARRLQKSCPRKESTTLTSFSSFSPLGSCLTDPGLPPSFQCSLRFSMGAGDRAYKSQIAQLLYLGDLLKMQLTRS